MPTTRLSHGSGATARLTFLVVAALAAAAALVGVAGPASAAPTITITPTPAKAVVGEPLEVSWTASSEVTSLTASGDWATNGPVALTGSQTITPSSAGDLTLTLTGQVANADPVVETVTVEVADAAVAPTEVTAVAPTYPETCAIEIPEVEGVDYVIDFGDGDVEVIDPDVYPVVLFALSETEEITVQAQDGFVLAAGSPTSFPLEVDPSCAPEERELVRTTSGCRSVSFTNLADEEALYIEYGDLEGEEADGSFTLASGQSRTISTNRAVLGYFAGSPEIFDEDTPIDEDSFDDVNFDIGEVRVQLACGDHPTVAPAAGR